jgi:pyruvate-formate lyase
MLDEMSAFTETYRRFEHAHPALREMECLRVQYPAVLGDIQDDDLFAGRTKGREPGFHSPIGFRHSPSEPENGFYCNNAVIEKELQREDLPAEWRGQLRDLLDYWCGRTTADAMRAKVKALPALAREIERLLTVPSEFAGRTAGLILDFDKLLRLGIPGLKTELAAFRANAAMEKRDPVLYEAMTMALDLLIGVCRHYAEMAKAQAASSAPRRKQELEAMAEALERITTSAPATFRETIQLWWLYVLLSSSDNFGRMDVFLGDAYAGDIDSGRLTEEQALTLMIGLYKIIEANIPNYQARILLGGIGRRNPASADRFTLLALEAYRVRRGTIPQLSLRCHKGMDRKIWATALDLIGLGGTMPMLYNDEVIIPSLANAFGVSREEATQYITSDCGEYHLEHRSLGAPNGNISLAKILEITLHNGTNALLVKAENGNAAAPAGCQVGLATGQFSLFQDFEELWQAYCRQVDLTVQLQAERLATFYDAMDEAGPFLFESLLYDDCLPRGKGIFAGGARYTGLLNETYGNITASDSLTAIKDLVYDRKVITPKRLLAALDANWEGYQAERSLSKRAPKYGNDDPAADGMALRVHRHICHVMKKQAPRVHLDFFLADLVNVDGHVTLGRRVAASADGRANGEPLTNGNNPSGGSDRKGPTALLNSLAKLDPSNIAGQVQHMKFSREMFAKDREKLEQLLETYFSLGGPQAMITVVSRGDLEDALIHPEKHSDLVVRVGGFSARFVTLYRELQEEIISRTLN